MKPVTHRRPAAALVVSILAIPWGLTAPAAPPAQGAAKGNITPEELRDTIEKLASDEYEGRGSGSGGGKKAGDFLAEEFKARGVKPLTGDSYFQPFDRDGGSFRNIVGVVPGTDAAKSKEYLVLGAHYDHCGMGEVPGAMGNKGEIHHGADDNASGTASVLAIARMLVVKPLPRPVVLILFDAEERGLWGSQHYCAAPLVPLDQTIAMINLDMVGRSYDGYLFVGGLGSSPNWEEHLTKAVKTEGALLKNLERDDGALGPSDHDSFYRKEIPVLFFFTNCHRDYHQPRDVPEKIQYKPMAAICRLTLQLLRNVGSAKTRPTLGKASGTGLPKGFPTLSANIFQRAAAMARRLGGKIEATTEGPPFFADVQPAGSRAGFEKGDVIVAIGKGTKATAFKDVKSVEELRVETEKFKVGDPFQLKILRAGKPMTISSTIGEVPEWKYGPATDPGDLPRAKSK